MVVVPRNDNYNFFIISKSLKLFSLIALVTGVVELIFGLLKFQDTWDKSNLFQGMVLCMFGISMFLVTAVLIKMFNQSYNSMYPQGNFRDFLERDWSSL